MHRLLVKVKYTTPEGPRKGRACIGEVVSVDYKSGQVEALFAGDLKITLDLAKDDLELFEEQGDAIMEI